MTDTEMEGLVKRLEAATGPDRELDARIAVAVGATMTATASANYTGSIDAALTLVPEGGYMKIMRPVAESAMHPEATVGSEWALGKTIPLALCIAALKARSV